jgi:hypothetical protein
MELDSFAGLNGNTRRPLSDAASKPRGYVDDLRATAKLLAGERHLPKPRAANGREMRDALLPTSSPAREISAEAVRSPHAPRSRGR